MRERRERRLINVRRKIEVRHDVDVFVAGGGPAGVAAAIAAARQGASVFMAEAQVCFGGMGTAGALPLFCHFTDGVNFVAGGIGREVYNGLFAMGGTVSRSKPGDSDIFFRPEALKLLYDRMVPASGCDFTLMTRVVGVEGSNGRLTHAICAAKIGIFAVKARAFVDATGDGDICAWAGAPFEKGDEKGRMQPGTLVSIWGNIDWNRAEKAGCGVWKQSQRLMEAIGDGVFTVRDPGMPGILPAGPRSGNGSIGHLFGLDGTDERSLTTAAITGRRMMREYETYFKRYLKGYERMELVGSAAMVGVRETRRITGDYVLNADDYWTRAVFEDEIGRYCYKIDVHPENLNDTAKRLKEFNRPHLGRGESYGIPYRILTPRGLKNVLVAGRCVSTDRQVQGSLRVMPGCFITGQAAGVAAAMAARHDTDTRSISVPELQSHLLKLGAFLPNCRETVRRKRSSNKVNRRRKLQ